MRTPEHGTRALRIGEHIAFAIAVLVAITFIAAPLWITSQLSRLADWSTRPPQEAFQGAFRCPLPSGISDLQAAGFLALGGGDVWLRFRATDAVVAVVTRGSRRIT